MVSANKTRSEEAFFLSRFLAASLMALSLIAVPAALAQSEGDLPDPPHNFTLENQAQYANLVLNDLRPIDPNDSHNNPYTCFKNLRLKYKMPLKFTWDQAALKSVTDYPLLLTGLLNDVCDDIVTWLGSNQGAYFKGPLSKVKELHFTVTPKKRSNADALAQSGYYLSFNKATGVLTAAMSAPDGTTAVSNSSGSPFGEWITKNVK